MKTILIGLDDTDNPTSKGTGHLARLVSQKCQDVGLHPLGVTRHQFPTDPRIPYTSHNSGACVAMAGEGGTKSVNFVFDFVARQAAEGSDPGVCIAEANLVPEEIITFSKTATSQVVEKAEALRLAEIYGISLRELGGTGLGVIGALASVGLRADGNEGRFIDLPGLRELPNRVTVKAFDDLDIRLEHQRDGREPTPSDEYETLGWVRPRLSAGQRVLWVEWSENHNAWIPVDRKKSRPLE